MQSHIVEIIPISEKYIESYHACLDSVARERIYLAGVQAPPIESTRQFVHNNINNDFPQFIAVNGEKVVGWCDIIPRRGVDFAHIGTLGMGVNLNFRGRGIGSRLLRATIDAAKDYGLERVELEVYTSNKVAMHLYKKFGFKIEGVKEKARKLDDIYYDIQIMALFVK